MEHRKITKSVLVKADGKSTSIKLYDALQWPDQYGTGAGLYRIGIGRAWHSPAGAYTFLPPAAVGELVAKLINGGDCVIDYAKTPPQISTSQRVSVPTVYFDGAPLVYEGGYPSAPPHLGPDGRWHLWCRCAEAYYLVPFEDIIIHRR